MLRAILSSTDLARIVSDARTFIGAALYGAGARTSALRK